MLETGEVGGEAARGRGGCQQRPPTQPASDVPDRPVENARAERKPVAHVLQRGWGGAGEEAGGRGASATGPRGRHARAAPGHLRPLAPRPRPTCAGRRPSRPTRSRGRTAPLRGPEMSAHAGSRGVSAAAPPERPLPHPMSRTRAGYPAGRASSSMARSDRAVWMCLIREFAVYLDASVSLYTSCDVRRM